MDPWESLGRRQKRILRTIGYLECRLRHICHSVQTGDKLVPPEREPTLKTKFGVPSNFSTSFLLHHVFPSEHKQASYPDEPVPFDTKFTSSKALICALIRGSRRLREQNKLHRLSKDQSSDAALLQRF